MHAGTNIVNFRVQRTHWPHPFLTKHNQKIFNHYLIFENLYEYAKNEVVSSICFVETFDLKILQSDWQRGFRPIFKEQDFSQYRICAGTK